MATTVRARAPKTIARLPIGAAGLQLAGTPKTEHLRWGPTALDVGPDGGFVIADAAAARLVRVASDGALGRSLDLRGQVTGIADVVSAREVIYLLEPHAMPPRVVAITYAGALVAVHPLPLGLTGATGIALGRQGELELELGPGRFRLLDEQGALAPGPVPVRSARGASTPSDPTTELVVVAGHTIRVQRRARRITYRLLGVVPGEPEDDIMVIADEATMTGRGLRVDRTVRRHTAEGELAGVARVPASLIPVPNRLAIGPDGAVYVLTVRPSGALVRRLRFSPGELEPDPRLDEGLGLPHAARDSAGRGAEARATITRDQIIATARAYLTNRTSLSTKNIEGENVQNRQKPGYLGAPGEYASVPYQWGGFDKVETFNRKMTEGQAAGDVNCVGNVKAGASGVDCSGFVSQCWGLTEKRSTETLPSEGIALARIEDCLPGDIVNSPMSKAGHVRLVKQVTPAGDVEVFESTVGENADKVVESSYSVDRLRAYTPYRFRGVTDARPAGPRYIAAAKHFVNFGFRAFFEDHGESLIVGLPLSEEFDERCDDGVERTVQYFERAVFEFHGGRVPVQLRLLGHHERERRFPGGAGLPPAFQPLATPPSQGRFFAETRHHINGGFRLFFDARPDAVVLFGLPISEEFTEPDDDGAQRTVQYFERAVFVFHGGNRPVRLRPLGQRERDQRFPPRAGVPVPFHDRRPDGSIG